MKESLFLIRTSHMISYYFTVSRDLVLWEDLEGAGGEGGGRGDRDGEHM